MSKKFSDKFIDTFSGGSGIAIVIAVLLVALAASVYSLYRVRSAVEAASEESRTPAAEAVEKSDSDTEAAPVSESGIITESGSYADTAEKPVKEKETGSETEDKSVSETQPESESDAVTKSGTESGTVDETESESETEDETENESETDAETVERDEDRIIVCIDPGHGYDDPGTDSDYLGEWSEKDIDLDIALRVSKYLCEKVTDTDVPFEVYMTRKDDNIPADAKKNDYDQYLYGPHMREEYIESIGIVDAVVSIHCDYYEEDPSIDGVHVFYSLGVNKKSASLALDIGDSIGQIVGKTAGGKLPDVQYTYYDDAYYITKCTPFPSVLVECGYVTNKKEAANLMDEKWRQKMAEAIAEGIITFLHV